MRRTAAARRYARALFSLASEEQRVEEVREELASLAALLAESRELRQVVLTPLHPVKERKGVLNALTLQLHLSPTVRHFFALLIDHRRLVDYASIREEYERLAQEASGRLTASVVSATPLDDDRRERLRQALSERTGRQVDLDVEVDPGVIGGVVAKVGDLVFDGSLRTQLRKLRANLTRES